MNACEDAFAGTFAITTIGGNSAPGGTESERSGRRVARPSVAEELERLVCLASVTGGGEIATTNDSSSDTTTIVQLPDLAIAKTHIGSFAQCQSGATYTITVTNSGSAATSAPVTVIDTLPPSLSATAIDGGPSWSCTLATLTCIENSALGAAASYPPITVTVNVARNAPASVINTVTSSGGDFLAVVLLPAITNFAVWFGVTQLVRRARTPPRT